MSRSKTSVQIFTFFVNNVLFHGVLHLKQQTKYERPLFFCVVLASLQGLWPMALEDNCPLGGWRAGRWQVRGEVLPDGLGTVAGL